MEAMRLEVDSGALALFPELTVHAVICDLPSVPAIPPREPTTNAPIAVDPEAIACHASITPWRAAMKVMGLKPSDCRGSVEQLVRRALRGGLPTTGVPWVDAYNHVSVVHLAPLGGYDLEAIGDRVVLRRAAPDDRFEPLGGDPGRFPLTEDVVVYATGNKVMCWALNVRDSALTCLKPESRRALFISEAVNMAGALAGRAALAQLAERVRGARGFVGDIVRVDADGPVALLSGP